MIVELEMFYLRTKNLTNKDRTATLAKASTHVAKYVKSGSSKIRRLPTVRVHLRPDYRDPGLAEYISKDLPE